MRIKSKNLTTTTTTLLLLISCLSFSCKTPAKVGTDIPVVETITIDIPEITLPETSSGSTFVTFKSSADWTLETSDTKASPTWFDVSPQSGMTGTHTLTVAVKEANPEYEDRSAYIKLKTTGVSELITVYQKKKNAILISKDRYDIPSDGGTFSVEVKSNVQYSVLIPDETATWISKTTNAKSITTTTEIFTVSPSALEDEREGIIIFTDGTLKDTVHIFQTEKNILATIELALYANYFGHQFDFSLRTNVNYTVRIKCDGEDWITHATTKTVRVDKIYFNMTENTSMYPRSAQIIFSDTYNILSDTVVVIQGSKPVSERECLIEFYNQTGGDSWKNKTNWCSDKPLSEWWGITVSNDHVTELDLNTNNLTNSIPTVIEHLNYLKSLKLQNNSLEGDLPSAIRHLFDLCEVNLSRNKITGIIPEGMFFASNNNIQTIILNNNLFYGNISEDIGTLPKLTTLNLSYNVLSGSIPSTIFKSQSIEYLNLEDNTLSGVITSDDINMPKVREIKLSHNLISGAIPKNIGNSTQLRVIEASDNTISGTIPESMINLTNLGILDLRNNNITGGIPTGFDKLINLDGTPYSSTYPTQPSLETSPEELYTQTNSGIALRLSGNKLSEHIPSDFLLNQHYSTWNALVNVLPQQAGYRLTIDDSSLPDIYESTDYSEDGKYITLQSASRGNGIDIVIMGDGFVDRDFTTNGKWETTMQSTFSHLFDVEPMKSYRDYFNVYAVKAVSLNEEYIDGAQTVFEVKFTSGVKIDGNNNKCLDYASKSPMKDFNKSVVIVVINSSKYAGTTIIYNSMGALAYVPIVKFDDQAFAAVLRHEALGHGVAKLGDEYVYYKYAIHQNMIDNFNILRNTYNYNYNMTINKNDVPWSNFIGHPKYPMVGLYEGGFFYSQGVWRAEENHCMNNNVPYFNGPSRELFVKRIKLLSGENYNWNEFVANDKYEPYLPTKSNDEIYNNPPLSPPVFINDKR